ncbi:MAG: diaminopimelate decarboxylase [Jatrophihabitans sp.]
MQAYSATLDCRGLTPALTVLRIKQAVCASQASDPPLRVILGTECEWEQVCYALAEVAERVRYVVPDSDPPADVVGSGALSLIEAASPWWQRPDLRYDQGHLHLGTVDLAELAGQIGTPAYVCRGARVKQNIERLSEAMRSAGLEHRIYYAIKANRSPSLLSYLRALGLCGVDVCSTGELMHAISCGFSASEISFTGTSLSSRDIDVLSRFSNLRINLDSLSSLNSIGRACPGREVGLRINPAAGVGYQGDSRLNYSGAHTTKFGIYLDHIAEAKAIAQRWGLRVVRLHLHVGCGFLDAQLDQLAEALDAANTFTEHFAELREINLGGGLGVPHNASDQPLDLGRWAAEVARRFAGRNLLVAIEPGDYLVKDAGLLLASVTYVERRRDVLFAGLDAGFNLAMEPAFYGLACEPVPVIPRWDEGSESYTVVGNINEALDIWAVDHRMTRLRADDQVALINAGGYAASMRSEHCLRGQAREVLLIDEESDSGTQPAAHVPLGLMT